VEVFGAVSGVRADPRAVLPTSFPALLVADVQALSIADPATSAEP
jgi:hypothetical protein